VPGGTGVSNFYVAQVNQSCTPSVNLYGGTISLGSYVIPILADGSFTLSYSTPGTVGPWAANSQISIQGRFNSSIAAGTLKVDTQFTSGEGTHYGCTSGTVSWTATPSG